MRLPTTFIVAALSSVTMAGLASAQDAATWQGLNNLDMPSYQEPMQPWETVEEALRDERECRDRIHQVREESGQPKLDEDAERSEDPMAIAAVDHRIDGCSVLVMHGDGEDIRPLPKASDDTQFRPLER